MSELQLAFLLLLFVVAAVGAIEEKLRTPYPIVLVIAGLLISLVPKFPAVTLTPDLVFFVVLPPLIYAGAWLTSWREFSYNLVSILLLAIGLVFFTTFIVAYTAHWMIPLFDWRSGFLLGAVVSTTDAVAAIAIARRLGLDRRIVDIVSGESLVNDATGLLALEFGIAMVTGTESLSVGTGMLRFAELIAIGLATGFAIAFAIDAVSRHLDDAKVEITLSLLVPYATYIVAERLHGSGVLAVVVCGLYLSRRSVHFFSPAVRVQVSAFWNAFTFMLNGLVFVAIGLQLRTVLAAITRYSFHRLMLHAIIFTLFLIAVRLVWIYPGAFIAHVIRTRLLRQAESFPSGRSIFIAGWMGMRGVIALAAALSLPAIPQRNIIVFLTFSVILGTLVLQGLSLTPLIRLLGLSSTDTTMHDEIRDARIAMTEAALHELEQRRSERDAFGDVYDDLARHYSMRLAALREEGADEHGSSVAHAERHREMSRELVQLERATAVRLRDEGRLGDQELRELLNDLDLAESRLE